MDLDADEEAALAAFMPGGFGKKAKPAAKGVGALRSLDKAQRVTPLAPATTKRGPIGPPTPASSSAAAAAAAAAPQPPAASAAAAAAQRGVSSSPPPGPPRPTAKDRRDDDKHDAMMGPPRPRRLAQPTAAAGADDEPSFVGPPRPAPSGQMAQRLRDDADAATAQTDLLPTTHQIALTAHAKPISAMAFDRAGNRLLTGGLDECVHFWDFAGMSNSLNSFRAIEPAEGMAVAALCWSCNGEYFVTGTGDGIARFYTRDGIARGETNKGDPYIMDLKHTKGHVMGITAANFHPSDKNSLMTCGADGTVRFWDTEKLARNTTVVQFRKIGSGIRTQVTCATWQPTTAACWLAGTSDGGLFLYDTRVNYSRARLSAPNAHGFQNIGGVEVTGVALSEDGVTCLSRGMDDTMKVWDLRLFTEPVKNIGDMPNIGTGSGCIFSPDDKWFVGGTCLQTVDSLDDPRGEKKNKARGAEAFVGRLSIFDKATMLPAQDIQVPGGVTGIAWHPKLNQLAVCGMERSALIFFSPELSRNGALLPMSRAAKSEETEITNYIGEIRPVGYTPDSLPLFREESNHERVVRERARFKPDILLKGAEPQLKSSHTMHLMKYFVGRPSKIEEDPREAILKYAEVAKNDPRFVANAYAETQPVPIFAEVKPQAGGDDDDDEEDHGLTQAFKKRAT